VIFKEKAVRAEFCVGNVINTLIIEIALLQIGEESVMLGALEGRCIGHKDCDHARGDPEHNIVLMDVYLRVVSSSFALTMKAASDKVRRALIVCDGVELLNSYSRNRRLAAGF
jgi:hypothetical protein